MGPASAWMGDSNSIAGTRTRLSLQFSGTQALPLHQLEAEVRPKPILFISVAVFSIPGNWCSRPVAWDRLERGAPGHLASGSSSCLLDQALATQQLRTALN